MCCVCMRVCEVYDPLGLELGVAGELVQVLEEQQVSQTAKPASSPAPSLSILKGNSVKHNNLG